MSLLKRIGRLLTHATATPAAAGAAVGNPPSSPPPPGPWSDSLDPHANIAGADPTAEAETVRLTLDRKVSPGGSVYFTQAADAEGWPLIERLFRVDAVHAILARENTLVVSRTPGASLR